MPLHKGAISGIILGGYNFGPVFYLLFFTYLANPDNEQASIIDDHGEINQHYFGPEVSNRTPMAIRWNALLYYLICLIGIACLPKSINEHSTEETSKKKFLTLSQMIRDYRFWHLFILLFFGSGINAYFLNMYKIVGMAYIHDDHFLSYIGSASFLFGTAGRIVFGVLMDKYS